MNYEIDSLYIESKRLVVGCPTDPEEGTTETTYTVTANGSSSSATTTLTFAFSADVSGLTADVITLGTGVTKGNLTGSGKNWSLASADNARWYKDSITETDTGRWYKFTAEAGKTYHVQSWTGMGQPDGKTKTAWVDINAYKQDGTTKINEYELTDGWESGVPLEITADAAGTIYLKVELYSTSSGTTYPGTYALRVYDTAAIVPQGPIHIATASGYPSALAKNAVRVSWLHYVPDAALTKYEIHRSTAQTGTYAKVGEVTGQDMLGSWFIPHSYTDENAPANSAYWYKVIAVNATGTGAATAPVKSDTVNAYSTATSYTVSATAAATAVAGLQELTFTADEVTNFYKT